SGDGSVMFWAPTGVPASAATSAPVHVSGPDAGPWTVTVDPPGAAGSQDDAYVFFHYTLS
ncbi:MAG TPA: hypothetical protein VN893_04760, partial [Bryobacteraceae bacterium]|nr:hypothetical protein [Bryobacteraceae bacterium]